MLPQPHGPPAVVNTPAKTTTPLNQSINRAVAPAKQTVVEKPLAMDPDWQLVDSLKTYIEEMIRSQGFQKEFQVLLSSFFFFFFPPPSNTFLTGH
jgi:hypothetical protein